MCILFIAKNQHPRYPLIIAANRDEFFSRASKPASYWKENPEILAGKDLKSGGTWFGVNTFGRIAAITNLRAPELVRSNAMSRGGLVSRFLRGEERRLDFENYLATSSEAYNPFNMLFGNLRELLVFNSAQQTSTYLADGFHSISNGFLEDYWPKMSRGVTLVKQHVLAQDVLDPDGFAEVMRDDSPAQLEQLPDTGISLEYEKALSSIFIQPVLIAGRYYGTRSTTLLLCERERVHFIEYVYHLDGSCVSRNQFQIPLILPR